MTLFILVEISVYGYALLKARNKKVLKRHDLVTETATAEEVSNILEWKEFQKFDSTATALEELTAVIEGKVTPRLANLLDSIKDEKESSLAIADPKLGNAIGKLPGLSIQIIADSSTSNIYRAIRTHILTLIPGLASEDLSTMSLGLSHSHTLKSPPDNMDFVQAIALLDDLDKGLKSCVMKMKKWYGSHFPEMTKIVNDNISYAKIVLKMGMRTNSEKVDLSEIIPGGIGKTLKTAADRSIGVDIGIENLKIIQTISEEIIRFAKYRQQLASHLTARMIAIAPNLTALVGELVGARLIAHAGSLMNLSKLPSSTLQIYGAEEAFFQAVKTNHNTPKFGLISHASLVVEATAQNKGKMARILAAKASLCARIDAHTTWKDDATAEEKAAFGMEARYELERKLAAMEGKPKGEAIAPPPSKMVKQEEPIIKNGSEPSESRDVDMTDDESDEDEEIEERFHGKKGDDSFSDDSEKEGKKHKSKKDKNKSGLEKMAKKAGLSIKRYQRKLEHGETKFDTEGDPTSIDKKEVERPREETKKAMKAEAKEAGKKRKRTDDGGKQVIGTEKKKKE